MKYYPQALTIFVITAFLTLLNLASCQVLKGEINIPPVPSVASGKQLETTSQVTAKSFSTKTVSQLQEALDTGVAEQEIPGAVMYVETPAGKWVGAAGVADKKTKTPMKPSDRFRIGSITKTFVSVVVLQLAEEGKLNLDDAIAKWLPTEISKRLPKSNKITIRQLLNHTSGLANYDDTDEFNEAIKADPKYNWTAEEVIKYVYDLPLDSEPGEKNDYSNTNYILLELIVEKVDGKTLAQDLRDRIHTPLNLKDTYMEVRETLPGGIVHGYADWDGDGKIDDVTLFNEGNGLGDGGIISTASDLATFVQALLAKKKLLPAKSLNQMLTFIDDGEGGKYGLGVASWQTSGGKALGHTGIVGGFLTTMFYLSERDITVVVLANEAEHAAPDDIAEKALKIILQK